RGAMATIWRGGCIIRARFLDRIREAYAENDALESLLVAPYFAARRAAGLAPVRAGGPAGGDAPGADGGPGRGGLHARGPDRHGVRTRIRAGQGGPRRGAGASAAAARGGARGHPA
ncbi:hypothetical protein KDL01_05665, partial [Actinospica durhamensis]|nr:hypothetical protein [Actinospica durhamensis]